MKRTLKAGARVIRSGCSCVVGEGAGVAPYSQTDLLPRKVFARGDV